VREPSEAEIAAIPEGALLLACWAGEDAARIESYRARRLGVFSLNALPRISRAQKMDALSSMAACAGYKAVLLAANTTGKFFPRFMTAAGTVAPRACSCSAPALRACRPSRREASGRGGRGVRRAPAVKEEVQSLGATFVDMALGEAASGRALREGAGRAAERADPPDDRARLPVTDVVISTASIPAGRRRSSCPRRPWRR